MSKERRLGRGLEALLGRPADDRTADVTAQTPTPSTPIAPQPAAPRSSATGHEPVEGHVMLGIYDIDRNPYQPRVEFDESEIQSLCESLGEHGMLQPLVVRQVGDRFELVSGERRWRAATIAGWEKVPVHIRQADDRQMAEWAIVENVQRKDLGPLEKAASFHRYIEQYGCTQEELARRVSIDRSTIANLIRLLELPEAVKDALRKNSISQGHARALLPLGDEREQVAFCRRIGSEALSVRATEELVHEAIRQADAEPLSVFTGGGEEPAPSAARTRGDHLSSLEQELRTALGTKVELKQTRRGSGRIVVHFKNNDEFERLRELLHRHTEHRAAG